MKGLIGTGQTKTRLVGGRTRQVDELNLSLQRARGVDGRPTLDQGDRTDMIGVICQFMADGVREHLRGVCF